MRRISTVVLVVVLSVSYLSAQEYTFKRIILSLPIDAGVVPAGSFFKISGKVSVSDSVIVINTAGQVSEYYVENTADRLGFKQFRVLEPLDPDKEIRFTLNNQSSISKKETASLNYEIKDNFRNTVTIITYPLIPSKTNSKQNH